MSTVQAVNGDLLRPRQHFTPRQGWMNDPNGLVVHGGRWHLFFQHNPHGTDWGSMSWGHAWSVDLRTWHEEPVAILHDADEDVFSGSVVVARPSDRHDAPRAGDLVAVYTSVGTASSDRAGSQAQALATSADGGRTWSKRAGGPVLDRGSTDFRDPHVFRWSDGVDERWVMVAVEAVERAVVVYGSDDLVEWHPLSRFAPVIAVDGIWECPDLFPLTDPDSGDVRWVLLLSVGDGHPAGGSGMVAFIGDFDGETYTADAEPEWVDQGRDCYAGVTFTDALEGRRVMVAWMSNWQYAHVLPDHGWRGAMTLPRELALRTVDGRPRLVQHVAVEIAVPLAPPTSRPLELLAGSAVRITSPDGDPVGLRLRLERGQTSGDLLVDGPGCTLSWSLRDRELVLDRRVVGGYGAGSPFPSTTRVPLSGDTSSVELYFDNGSVEVVAGDGATVLTALLPPSAATLSLTLLAVGGSVVGHLESSARIDQTPVPG